MSTTDDPLEPELPSWAVKLILSKMGFSVFPYTRKTTKLISPFLTTHLSPRPSYLWNLKRSMLCGTADIIKDEPIRYSSGVKVKPATQADALQVAKELRVEDVNEMRALLGNDVAMSVVLQRHVMEADLSFTVSKNNHPVAIFGTKEICPNVAAIGLLSSPMIREIKYTLCRHSKHWVDQLHKNHDLLLNIVHCDNTVHIQWLKWLGFTFVNKLTGFGSNGEDFYEFSKLKVKK